MKKAKLDSVPSKAYIVFEVVEGLSFSRQNRKFAIRTINLPAYDINKLLLQFVSFLIIAMMIRIAQQHLR